jgi:hypothetical protein
MSGWRKSQNLTYVLANREDDDAIKALIRRGNDKSPNTQKVTVLPDWSNRDLKLGTLRSAIRQLGIDQRSQQAPSV